MEATVIIKVSTVCSLINMCLMPLLVSASFIDFDGGNGWLQAISFTKYGQSDFNSDWYYSTGVIIKNAMLISIFRSYTLITKNYMTKTL